MADVFDSYTGDPYREDYQSEIEGIEIGRSPFYKIRELREISEQYWISPYPAAGEASPSGWLVRRRGCPSNLFPVMPALAQAVAVMDWLVVNDGSVGVAIFWLARKQANPYLKLLDHILEVASGVSEKD